MHVSIKTTEKCALPLLLQYAEVQRVLRDEIVNPLRQRLFVRADKVMALRTMLDALSSVSGLTDQEKDPEEFLNSLFNQVGTGYRRYLLCIVLDSADSWRPCLLLSYAGLTLLS